MADTRQHFGALVYIAVNALAHGEESLRGAAHFDGAIGLEIGHGPALAEAFGGAGQPLRWGAPDCAGTGRRWRPGSAPIPPIQRINMSGPDTVTRSRGATISRTPVMVSTLMFEILADAAGDEMPVLAHPLGDDVVQCHVNRVARRQRWRQPRAVMEGQAIAQLPRRQRP